MDQQFDYRRAIVSHYMELHRLHIPDIPDSVNRQLSERAADITDRFFSTWKQEGFVPLPTSSANSQFVEDLKKLADSAKEMLR